MARIACGREKLSTILALVLAASLAAGPSYAGPREDVQQPTPSGDGSRFPPDYDGDGKDGGSWVPAAIVGIIALGIIAHALSKEKGPPDGPPPHGSSRAPDAQEKEFIDRLRGSGPQFAPEFNMSAFAVRGLVRGGWPIVIDFEQGEPGEVKLRISAKGAPEIYTYRLSKDRIGRRRIQLPLPGELGDHPRPALIAVTATDSLGRRTLPSFQVYGLGVGPRAVGSVAIDQVWFQPSSIRVTRQETAAYRFFSHSDFNNASVEFMKVENSNDGIRHYFVDDEFIGGVRKDQWIGEKERRDWDGKDQRAQISTGPHKLQVRVWDREGDWVAAWSYSVVRVSK